MSLLNKRVSTAILLLVLASAITVYCLPAAEVSGDYLRHEIKLNQFHGSKQAHCALTSVDDELLVSWDSRRQQGGQYGIYARRIDLQGHILGSEFCLNLHQDSHQMRPDLAGRLAVWESWGQDGSGNAVMGRIARGAELSLAEHTTGDQVQPVALTLADGRLLAAWVTPSDRPGDSHIAARLFDPTGLPLTPEFVIAARSNASLVLPCLAVSGDGFVASWTSHTRESNTRILARLFDINGQPRSDELTIGQGCYESSLAATRDGGFAIAWLEPRAGKTRTIYRLFAGDGTPISPALPLGDSAYWHNGAAIAANDNGEIAVAWNRINEPGDDSDIMVQLLTDTGSLQSPAILVNGHTAGNQHLATASGSRRLLLSNDGSLAIAWSGNSGQGDKSAANLTLLHPRAATPLARLVQKGRILLGDLAGRTRRTDSEPAADATAVPYQPPVFNPNQIQAVADPEPWLPAAPGRDEGWQGITNTGWNPPDPHMAIGPLHVMAIVNGGVAAFEKDGDLLWQLDINGSSGFWGEVGAGTFLFDSEVVFDPHDNRFVVMANEREGSSSYFLLAISATADPTGDWHKYRLNVTSIADSSIDSPNLSLDDEAIYLTADFFGPDRYLIYIIDKSSVLGGGTPVTTHYFHSGSQSFGMPVVYGDAPAMYMMQGFEGYQEDEIRIWAIRNPLTGPSLTSFNLPVQTYYRPAYARSQGTSQQVITFEARFWSCVYRDGSLWACHHASTTSNRSTTSAVWYEIEMNGWPLSGQSPTLRQQGAVLPNDTGFATFNSITVNAHGDAAMCFAYSSTAAPFSMVRVARDADDPLGEMREPVFIKTSVPGFSDDRWGDYSAIVVDPFDNARFWAIHEYAVSTSTWSTWVANFKVDPLTAVPDNPAYWQGKATAAWPNPSRGTSHLTFALRNEARVKLEIFDVGGRLVRSLDAGHFAPGNHEVIWDGRDASGRDVSAGRYVSRLEINGTAAPGHRLLLIR
ncbi:MAG: hypothetical protein GY835_17480 [bacterium]|nr:hypothetical protein [bacterium]